MRILLTLSELPVIRNGGRIVIQWFGGFAVLRSLWGAAVRMDVPPRLRRAPPDTANDG
ncbi:hypothetical protein N9I65_03775 [bacterium]|nr:hypothetical protein [bacterium]